MILMFLGGQPASAPFVLCSKFFTVTYFSYFILCIPALNYINSFVTPVWGKERNVSIGVLVKKAANNKLKLRSQVGPI